MIDICIIGGGASGLAAAVSAAEQKQGRVLILEKKQVPGKKIAASGNGRCNLTNRKCSGALETLDFFASLGVFTYTDGEGRVYPNSNQAKDVVYALVRAAKSLGVELKTECTVEKILPLSGRGGFQVRYKGGTLEAKKVLLACGGKAGPQLGTSGVWVGKSSGAQSDTSGPDTDRIGNAGKFKTAERSPGYGPRRSEKRRQIDGRGNR